MQVQVQAGAWYTRGDSVVGSVLVVPPVGWPSRVGGRPAGGPTGTGWSVGGTVYPTWTDAWRGAVRPWGWSGGRVPTATSYLRAWSVAPTVGDVDALRDLLSPVVVSGPVVSVVPVGIDLDRRGVEVRRLLYAGFGVRMARAGYDPEDVLQEVYRGILVRNRGRCPFDARKSSFGHYVHMVIECILSNYHRRESRRRGSEGSLEDLPEGSPLREGRVESDCEGGTDALALRSVSDRVAWALADGDVTDREARLALGVLPLIQAGHDPTLKGARECGWSESDWRLGVSVLRRVVAGPLTVR